MLNNSNYTVWAIRIKAVFRYHGLLEAVEPKPGEQVNEKKNAAAVALLYQALPESQIMQVAQYELAKDIWVAIKTRHVGADRVKEARLQTLNTEFESVKMKDTDSIDDVAARLQGLASQYSAYGSLLEEKRLVRKFLNMMPKRFINIVASIEQMVDLDTISFEEIVGRLKAFEDRVKSIEGEPDNTGKLMFNKLSSTSKGEPSGLRGKSNGQTSSRGRGRGRGGARVQQDRLKTVVGRNQGNEKSGGKKDKSQVQCFRCDKLGHYASVCPDRMGRRQEVNYAEATDHQEPDILMKIEQVFLNEEKISLKNYESEPKDSGVWYLDNGASNHMTGVKSYFTKLDEKIMGQVRFGDGSQVEIKGRGSISVACDDGKTRLISNVYYIPCLTSNILSMGQATENGCKFLLKDDFLLMFDKDEKLILKVFKSKNRLYKVELRIGGPLSLLAKTEDTDRLWHSRLGHLNFEAMKTMTTQTMVHGVPKITYLSNPCEICLAGKQARGPFPKHTSFRAIKPLKLIHGDLCGPISPITPAGKKYLFLLVDDFSRFMWGFLLSTKDEAFGAFKVFHDRIEREYGHKIGTLRTDRGGEFMSREFLAYCDTKGITRHFTAPYTPQQNGVVERRNRTVIEMVRSMLKENNVPRSFWGEASRHAIFILNRVPTKAVCHMTPYEALKGSKPNLEHLRVFGCVGYVKTPVTTQLKKLDDRSTPMVYLGSEPGSKAYRMFDPINNQVNVSRDVYFNEKQGWNWAKNEINGTPFKQIGSSQEYGVGSTSGHNDFGEINGAQTSQLDVSIEGPGGSSSNSSQLFDSPAVRSGQSPTQSEDHGSDSHMRNQNSAQSGQFPAQTAAQRAENGAQNNSGNGILQNPTPRRTTRETRLPAKYNDYILEGQIQYGEDVNSNNELFLSQDGESENYAGRLLSLEGLDTLETFSDSMPFSISIDFWWDPAVGQLLFRIDS
ncbi:hypothetical protein E3N88_21928 [Mikania micrantha]|uniref:Integrase catalytic domain-containing protein n=1 Tax=Mikania micrantha TaxID=192012 RepID=A0A5N6NAJ6_9ASTR|nr:hypothetical protein E3N88_21928 [Mikania micrantha]